MAFLTTAPQRIVAGLIIVILIFLSGVFAGWKHEHDTLVTFTAKVDQAGKDQNAAELLKEKEHDKTTMDVANSYSAELARLQHSSTSKVRSPTDNTSAVVISNGQRVGTCEGTVFYDNAMKCELQLKHIRIWVVEEHIPVK